MICTDCQRAGDAGKLAHELSLAHMFRREQWYKAKSLHAMCKAVDCYCQHSVKAID
jgi:hypothetical protein